MRTVLLQGAWLVRVDAQAKKGGRDRVPASFGLHTDDYLSVSSIALI